MHLVDQETMEAIELKAPRTSTKNAKILCGQLLGEVIFSVFSDQARAGIWTRLQMLNNLVPFIFIFFKDVHYLETLAGCMTRLTRFLPGDTVFTALARAFSDTTERTDRVVFQIAESSFTSCPAQSVDPVDLGLRQLYAYAMRHYSQMPKSPKPSTRKELMMRPTIHADPTVLREFAELAECLGFESPEITELKQYPTVRVPRSQTKPRKPLLVTDGAGVAKKSRCGLPKVEKYLEDGEYFFINHLDSRDEQQGEGITSFFVRKSIYSAFFGKASPLSLEEVYPREEAVQLPQDLEREKQEREEQEREERDAQELERQKMERQERGKRDWEEKAKQQRARETNRARSQRLKLKKQYPKTLGEQPQEREEGEELQRPSLEDERRLEDQQRIGLDELLDTDQDIDLQPGEDIWQVQQSDWRKSSTARRFASISIVVMEASGNPHQPTQSNAPISPKSRRWR